MMRKTRIFILTCLMSILTLTVNAQETKESYDWSKVIDAIVKVESRGNEKAYNPNGDCCGILQITKILVRETNQILANKKSTKRYTYADRFNAEKSKEMFIILQEHFNPEHNVEKAIRCWNRGFYGNWRGKSTAYYNKVMQHYNGDN